nr:pyruvate dehydrogenase (acetyl-transferring) E1 component subunit alpha [Thaumasiovibrio subtropicus]
MLRYLALDGTSVKDWSTVMSSAYLLKLYQHMVLVRLYDKKAIALQRTGQLGTYPSHLGAEAIGIGTGAALEDHDTLIPYYRDMPVQWMRGVSMTHNLLYWGGDERGSDFPSLSGDFPFCVPIATQCTHAVGVATAMKLRHQRSAVLVNLGDGATSKGDFSESINLAGVWQLPVVFVINNNQWAISVPRKLQSAALTLIDKAKGAGIPGVSVDGNDVIAVYDSVKEALQRARRGLGATVIEMHSYRLSDHTTADDASRYRPEEELKAAWQAEPLLRLKQYLINARLWTDSKQHEWEQSCGRVIEDAVAQYHATMPQAPESAFDHLYAELPQELHQQRDALIQKAMRMEADNDG